MKDYTKAFQLLNRVHEDVVSSKISTLYVCGCGSHTCSEDGIIKVGDIAICNTKWKRSTH